MTFVSRSASASLVVLACLSATPAAAARRPDARSSSASISDFSIEVVPTRIGCPRFRQSAIRSAISSNFSAAVRKIASSSSTRLTSTLVGIVTTLSP